MELSSLLGLFDGVRLDELMVWGVALGVGAVAFVTLARALEQFFDNETG